MRHPMRIELINKSVSSKNKNKKNLNKTEQNFWQKAAFMWVGMTCLSDTLQKNKKNPKKNKQ